MHILICTLQFAYIYALREKSTVSSIINKHIPTNFPINLIGWSQKRLDVLLERNIRLLILDRIGSRIFSQCIRSICTRDMRRIECQWGSPLRYRHFCSHRLWYPFIRTRSSLNLRHVERPWRQTTVGQFGEQCADARAYSVMTGEVNASACRNYGILGL